jgi:hydrogenase expression/formation protein HypD
MSYDIGAAAYEPVIRRTAMPCAIAGFDPVDILAGVLSLVRQSMEGKAVVDNCYSRVVSQAGNPTALAAMLDVFVPIDAEWRGLGVIPGSGLGLRAEYSALDARQLCPDFTPPPASAALGACRCGDVLCGVIQPMECSCFGTSCKPDSPLGACMVSQEGACRAYYQFRGSA